MVTLGFTASLAATLACSDGPAPLPVPEYSRICVDSDTNVRLEDERCTENNSGSSGGTWYFYPRGGYSAPAVRDRISGDYGSYTKPGHADIYSVPETGGFGGSLIERAGG